MVVVSLQSLSPTADGEGSGYLRRTHLLFKIRSEPRVSERTKDGDTQGLLPSVTG